MKYLLIIIAIVALIVLVVAIIGYALPVKHTASSNVYLNTPPEKVWQKLTDFKSYPGWRKNLRSVDVTSDTSWIETDQRGRQLPFVVITQEPTTKMVTMINSKELPFGGTWTFTLRNETDKTLVTITEDGEVYNPVFRFVSRFIIGYSASLNQYTQDLEQAFNKK